MNEDVLKEVGVQYEEGLTRFAGDAKLYSRCLKLFLKDTTFEMLCEAMEKEQYDEVFESAHTLKGIAGNLSLGQFYEEVCCMVEMLRHNRLESINAQFKTVSALYKQVTAAIEKATE